MRTTVKGLANDHEEFKTFMINKCAELENRVDYLSELILRIGDSFDRRMDVLEGDIINLESHPVQVIVKRG